LQIISARKELNKGDKMEQTLFDEAAQIVKMVAQFYEDDDNETLGTAAIELVGKQYRKVLIDVSNRLEKLGYSEGVSKPGAVAVIVDEDIIDKEANEYAEKETPRICDNADSSCYNSDKYSYLLENFYHIRK
jgi:hypothetical protein